MLCIVLFVCTYSFKQISIRFLKTLGKTAGVANLCSITLRSLIETENMATPAPDGYSIASLHLGHTEKTRDEHYLLPDRRRMIQASNRLLFLFEEAGESDIGYEDEISSCDQVSLNLDCHWISFSNSSVYCLPYVRKRILVCLLILKTFSWQAVISRQILYVKNCYEKIFSQIPLLFLFALIQDSLEPLSKASSKANCYRDDDIASTTTVKELFISNNNEDPRPVEIPKVSKYVNQ